MRARLPRNALREPPLLLRAHLLPHLRAHVVHAPVRDALASAPRLEKRERHLAHDDVVRLQVVEHLQRGVHVAVVAARLYERLVHVRAHAAVVRVVLRVSRGVDAVEPQRERDVADARARGDHIAQRARGEDLARGRPRVVRARGRRFEFHRARGAGGAGAAVVVVVVVRGGGFERRELLLDGHPASFARAVRVAAAAAAAVVVVVPRVRLALALHRDAVRFASLVHLRRPPQHDPRFPRVRRHRRVAQRADDAARGRLIRPVPRARHPLMQRPRPHHLTLARARLHERAVRRRSGRVAARVHPRQDAQRSLRVRGAT
eukprot:3815-Pelagococcus_subviridis.AAC.2